MPPQGLRQLTSADLLAALFAIKVSARLNLPGHFSLLYYFFLNVAIWSSHH
jgi:hypothetical protein